MISLSTPSRATAHNGVRIRVTACRKRLRFSRTAYKSINHLPVAERNSDLALPGAAGNSLGGSENGADVDKSEAGLRGRRAEEEAEIR